MNRASPWRSVALGVVLAVIAVLTVEAAYFEQFAFLSPWDDEGYFLLALRHVLDGYPLYDGVRIFYGPVCFGVKWILHGALGVPLTHDAVGLTAIAFRLVTATLAEPQSLYLWTGQPAPAPIVVPHDTRLLRDADIARLAAALDTVPHACLVSCRTVVPPRDSRVAALVARARARQTFGSCTVFEYRPP